MSDGETYDPFPRPGNPEFSGFPKQLQDDTIEYRIFHVSKDSLSPAQTRTQLIDFQRECTRLGKTLLKDYLWQRESFGLSLERDTKNLGGAWTLGGKTEYGDSIADDWVIVYILREASLKFQEIWIRVTDADGEFLLVEAANVLPRWLNPDIAEHRVWIHRGRLEIIPQHAIAKSASSGNISTPAITLAQAISFIRASEDRLVKSPTIEAEAFHRLSSYPSEISKTFHTSRVTIPRKLAFLLHRTPSLISAAVEAFYLRDQISIKSLRSESSDHLLFGAEDLVSVSVKFTRVGYAQLKSQTIPVPAYWVKALRGNMPAPEIERLELGMKVSCGFEMMMQDPQNQSDRRIAGIGILLDEIAAGEEQLPTDADVSSWSELDEDDSWMNIDYEEYEKELSGKGKGKDPSGGSGFGDAGAQDNLRRIVERFEQFLNDDEAGVEGAEWDDEDDSEEDSDDVGEDRDASFDEEEFENAMRQMMGMPGNGGTAPNDSALGLSNRSKVVELDSDEEGELDLDDIKKLTDEMEKELRGAGALAGDQTFARGLGGEDSQIPADDPQYVLLKNMLEAMKGQGAASGPAGNLLSALGLRLPQDDGNDADDVVDEQ